MCICIHIWMCVCVCVYIYIYVYVYIFKYTHTHTHTHTHTGARFLERVVRELDVHVKKEAPGARAINLALIFAHLYVFKVHMRS